MLGFFWSFANPLLLLAVYTFVFSVVLPARFEGVDDNYALFLFCGLLPWTWFSSALTESSNALLVNGNLIKKVLFPAEVLPVSGGAGQHGAFLSGIADPGRGALPVRGHAARTHRTAVVPRSGRGCNSSSRSDWA